MTPEFEGKLICDLIGQQWFFAHHRVQILYDEILVLREKVKMEREACAKIAEEKLRSIMVGNYSYLVDSYVSQIARAIRERGEK